MYAVRAAAAGGARNRIDRIVKIGTPRERLPGEARVAMTPESAKRLAKLGHECVIEAGAGALAGYADGAYSEVGVTVANGAEALWAEADIVAKVNPPESGEVGLLRSGQSLVSFFWPGQNSDLLAEANAKGATVLAMDAVPRISRAQKMDALSSMSNIAGYRAVIEAGNAFGRFFAGQVTAAGKIQPANVLVLGAGVAGLSAIGTSVSLGAVVRAFDVRPEVAEQIQSMGAEFLFLDFDEDASGEGGYAKPSSPEFREKQLELFRSEAPRTDIVITTALIPGRDAPRLWLSDMVEAMRAGSVVVDLAAERGGNCDLTVPGESITSANGVEVIGYVDLPSRMAAQSSALFAMNVFHLMSDLTPGKDGAVVHDMEDDVVRGVTAAHEGRITFPPPPPKTPAIAAKPPVPAAKELTPEEKLEQERAAFAKATRNQIAMIAAGGAFTLLVGLIAPPSFMQHFIVFVLSCFVGYQVIWNVNHALHTPLMSVTNAISGIIILGALLQIGSSDSLVLWLAAVSVLIASINIVGGFLVTRRMLAMFRKS